MQTLDLLVGIDIQACLDDGDSSLRRQADGVLGPLLEQLAASPKIRCGIHVSGVLLQWLEQHSHSSLALLGRAVREGRVEPIGGGFYDPILPAIPDHDVSGQLRLMRNLVERLLGIRPNGVWLVGRTWSAALTAQLHRAGYGYTLIDEANLLLTGKDRDELDGYHITERAGFCLALFPIHAELQRQLTGADLSGTTRALEGFMAGRDERTAVLSFDGVEPGARLDTLLTLLKVMDGQRHWIKSATFSDYMDREPANGRAYPPVLSRSEGLDDSLEGLGWERFLVDYSEVNVLHKRMLMASYRVQKMRMAAQARTQGASAAVDPRRLRELLQQACTHLWASQHHQHYWHGERPGFYDAGMRHRTLTRLLAVDRLADEALGVDPKRARQRDVDFDCDGHEELLVRAGTLAGIVAPQRGGALLALDLTERELPLGPVMRRRQEPYHVTSGENAVQLVGDDEDSVDFVGSLESTAELDERMWFDDHGRLSFVDHFLAPGTHLQSWYRSCFREAGDFVEQPYEIVTEQEPTGDDDLALLLGRSATVKEGGKHSLVRVEKRFVFSRSLPRMRVQYRLVNRYFEPVRTHFGVELNLMLPGLSSGQANYSAVCGDDDLMGGLDEPRELRGVSYLELLDEACNLVVCCYVEDATDLWLMPVETVNPAGGGLDRLPQGVGLMFHTNADLWGSEEFALTLRLEFMQL